MLIKEKKPVPCPDNGFAAPVFPLSSRNLQMEQVCGQSLISTGQGDSCTHCAKFCGNENSRRKETTWMHLTIRTMQKRAEKKLTAGVLQHTHARTRTHTHTPTKKQGDALGTVFPFTSTHWIPFMIRHPTQNDRLFVKWQQLPKGLI